MNWDPDDMTPEQRAMIEETDPAIYGGARGGGKTKAMEANTAAVIRGAMNSTLVIRGAMTAAGHRPQALEAEYKFHPDRRWRFDYALPYMHLAIEIEGGVWNRGRHTRGAGYTKDCEKYNEALILGWTVLRFTSEMVGDGRMLDQLVRYLHAND